MPLVRIGVGSLEDACKCHVGCGSFCLGAFLGGYLRLFGLGVLLFCGPFML